MSAIRSLSRRVHSGPYSRLPGQSRCQVCTVHSGAAVARAPLRRFLRHEQGRRCAELPLRRAGRRRFQSVTTHRKRNARTPAPWPGTARMQVVREREMKVLDARGLAWLAFGADEIIRTALAGG